MTRRGVWLLILLLCLASEKAEAQSARPSPPSSTAASTDMPLRWFSSDELSVATDSVRTNAGQTTLRLKHGFITELISWSLDGRALIEAEDATLVAQRGFVVLRDLPAEGQLFRIRYRYDPAGALPALQLHDPIPHSSDADEPSFVPGLAPVAERNADSGRLRISGSKTVGVQGGSNRDATVNQALQLSIAGQLTDGIGVRAEISDENLPVTPEGNTEELSDLDQVRIELFGDRGSVLLGDFAVRTRPGAFAPFERKLQGLWVNGIDRRGHLSVVAGAPQGERVEVEFRGREGVQGPYELLDGQRLDQSFIVAGTERVSVDGIAMVRGKSRDYSIDYVRGTVIFTERRPIGPEHRISVDFETSRGGYRRTVAMVGVDSVAIGAVRLRASLLSEGDDDDRPTDGEFSEEDFEQLRAAGDNAELARSSGIVEVELGAGRYSERFTGDGTRFFVLADSLQGDFELFFTRVDPLQGDYELDRVDNEGNSEFRYVGAGLGDYLLGRRIALPERLRLGVLGVELGRRDEGAWLDFEANISERDANQLSTLDDEDNDDVAWRGEFQSPRLGDEQTGVRVAGRAEAIGADFESPGRVRRPFYYDEWNLQDEVRDRREGSERLSVESMVRGREFSAALSRLHRSGSYDGLRTVLRGGGALPAKLRWNHRLGFTNSERAQAAKSRRRDRELRVSRPSVISPALRVFDERFRDGVAAAQRGYRSSGFAPSLHYLDAMERSLRVEFRRERADSLAADGANWNFARDIRQWDLRSSARTAGMSFAADANWREAKLPGSKSETTRLGDLKIGRRSPGSNFGFDLEYRAGTSETRVLGREILFVGFLEGDYDAEGNPVGVRQGDYNVVFTPSDSLVRATDVELQATVDYSADWQIVRGFSSRTLFTVRERSRSDDIGSVLRLAPSVVRDGELTLFGEERIREDLDLLRSNRRLDLRLSIDRRELLDQRFSQGPERSRRLTRNARLESQLAGAASVRVEIGDDARDRERDSTGNPLQVTYRVRDRFVAGTLRYRSSGRGRAAVALRVTRRDEELNGIEQDIAELLPSLTTELFRGRWTVEARYARIQEKEVGAVTRPFFFELAGTSRSSSVGAQWELGSAFTVGLRYSLRDEAQRALRQDLSLETRARF